MDFQGKWFFELITQDLVLLYKINNSLYSGKTCYQRVDILETDAFGKSLILDGKTQSTSRDEYIYHESLVHPALLSHPDPRSIFIGGGGEGATLREVLLHRKVERVTMVDLDSKVVELCRSYLPEHSDGAFDDSRAQIVHQDARKYLSECEESYDVVILDLVDPLEEGTAYTLYTREFYEIVRHRLRPGGILVTQSGPASLLNHTECFTPIVKTISTLFPVVRPYTIYVPAFVTPWAFTLAFTDPGARDCSVSEVDHLISERLVRKLMFYDGLTKQHMFSLPTYLRRGIAGENRIVTDDTPVFMV